MGSSVDPVRHDFIHAHFGNHDGLDGFFQPIQLVSHVKRGQHGFADAGVRAGDEKRLLHAPTSKRNRREITMALK